MQRTKRLLVAGGLAASVLAGGTLFSARPAAADDWDHPLRRVVRVLTSDGRYVNRYYYYDYSNRRYVPYSSWRRDRDDWRSRHRDNDYRDRDDRDHRDRDHHDNDHRDRD